MLSKRFFVILFLTCSYPVQTLSETAIAQPVSSPSSDECEAVRSKAARKELLSGAEQIVFRTCRPSVAIDGFSGGFGANEAAYFDQGPQMNFQLDQIQGGT
jgi:hypothetical protein